MKQPITKILLPSLTLFFISSVALAAYAPLKLDSTHSKIGFTASTFLFDVDGEFDKYSVEIDGNPADPKTAKIKVTIPVASINTHNDKRDKHLKSPDFFDAKKHPQIVFTSTSVQLRGKKLVIKGNLTMHGKTKQVTVPFTVAKGKNGAGAATTAYKGKLTIDRIDFGIGTDSIAAKISLENDIDLKLLIVTFD